jgi:uncharacterized protein with PIN domain
VDLNVGRLAKWLRALGYDAAFLPQADDGELVAIASREGRVLLTKDRHIMERRAMTKGQARALLVQGDRVMEQLAQVVRALGLDRELALSRCIACNVPLEERSREAVTAVVPEYVARTQVAFHQCPRCGRIYWRGTHWSRMREVLDAAVEREMHR